jgi:hypothetical protein
VDLARTLNIHDQAITHAHDAICSGLTTIKNATSHWQIKHYNHDVERGHQPENISRANCEHRPRRMFTVS